MRTLLDRKNISSRTNGQVAAGRVTGLIIKRLWFYTRPAKSTGLPSRLLVLLTPSTGLLGCRTFLLVLKKIHFWYLIFFSDLDLFFVCIHCLIIGSL